MVDIDRVEKEENITLEMLGESFTISSFDITRENQGEEYYGADEYEIRYDSRGMPIIIPKGPRKLQGVSVDRVAHGVVRGVGERPDIPHNEYGVPDQVDAAIEMESRTVDLPNTIFMNEGFSDGEWVFDFVSDLDD